MDSGQSFWANVWLCSFILVVVLFDSLVMLFDSLVVLFDSLVVL